MEEQASLRTRRSRPAAEPAAASSSSSASSVASTPSPPPAVASAAAGAILSGNIKPAVIFLGDSNCAALVTGLHGRPRGERCAEWAALCERFDCDNRGTNQLTLEGLTTQLRSRATCDALGRAAAAVVYIGKNDVASNGCEFIENKVAEIVADVRERMPPAHRRNILVLGLNAPDAPPPASAPAAPPAACSSSAPSPGGAPSPVERFVSVAALNSRLAELLPPLGAAFLDVRAHVAAAGAGSGGGEEVMIDRLHLGARACSKLTREVRRREHRARGRLLLRGSRFCAHGRDRG